VVTVAAAVVTAAAIAVATVAVADGVAIADVRITQLDNGLTVATERVRGARSVATGAWVVVGARDEPASLSGVSHFLEHLLFKGTPTRTARDISAAIERVGGDMNAFTSKEYTSYYCRVPGDRLELGLDVLGDVLSRPALRDDDVETEREVIVEELMMDDDSPEDVVHRDLAEALFPDHPLGRETAGERETVEAITADDVRSFFAEWYRARNMVVAVAGPDDHDTVLAAVSSAFAGVAEGGTPPRRGAPPSPLAIDRVRTDDTEQAHLTVGFRALARTDERREALDVLNHALGGGTSSRLFDEIRERRGLSYSVYSATSAYADGGALSVYAGTGPQHVATVRGVIDAELASIAANGVTADELDIAVGYLCGAFVMGLEDTGARMGRLGGLLATLGHVRPVDEQLARWRAVTLDDVAAVAADILHGPKITATVGPT
jgi:predicted Zn-dependent peptidase